MLSIFTIKSIANAQCFVKTERNNWLFLIGLLILDQKPQFSNSIKIETKLIHIVLNPIQVSF